MVNQASELERKRKDIMNSVELNPGFWLGVISVRGMEYNEAVQVLDWERARRSAAILNNAQAIHDSLVISGKLPEDEYGEYQRMTVKFNHRMVK